MMRTTTALTAVGAVAASPASPVKKVISLLQELKDKVGKDVKNEETDMAAYAQFCDDEQSEKGYAITTAAREIELLEATIEDSEGSIQKFAAEIDTDSKESAAKSADLQTATDIRAAENKDFLAAEQELVDTVDTLSRAIVILKREMSFLQGKAPGGATDKASFADLTNALSVIVDSAFLDTSSRQKVKSFMETQMDDELTLKQVPEGPQATQVSYENHGSGIVSTLEDLKDKAAQSLADLRKDEMTSKHNFQMLAQSLTDAVKVMDTAVAEAKSSQSEAGEVLGKAQGDLAEQESVKKADEAYVSNLKVECANKASEWEERQKTAAGEIDALAKGIEILTGHFGEGSFLQTKAVDTDPVRDQVTTLMKKLGRKFNSFGMMQIAQAAAADPFGKVRGLIESMIAKLETAAQEEATHDTFCKEETKKSAKSRDLKGAEADKYRSRIDEANAAMATLKSEITDLQSQLTEIAKATKEATDIRNKEKADYAVASKEYRESATAVTQALAVLKEYYNQGAAFVQVKTTTNRSGAPTPEFGAAKSDASTMILGILETAASDFTKLLAEAEATESEASDSFKKLLQDNRVAKASKEAAVKGKTSNLKSLEVQLNHHQENLDTVGTELDAVLEYLAKLKPQCESKAMTYEERSAAREAELEGLKEALQILEGEAAAFVQKKSFLKTVKVHAP